MLCISPPSSTSQFLHFSSAGSISEFQCDGSVEVTVDVEALSGQVDHDDQDLCGRFQGPDWPAIGNGLSEASRLLLSQPQFFVIAIYCGLRFNIRQSRLPDILGRARYLGERLYRCGITTQRPIVWRSPTFTNQISRKAENSHPLLVVFRRHRIQFKYLQCCITMENHQMSFIQSSQK